MNIFGDIERLFVDVVWPIGVPVAIGLVAGVAALLLIARRRGWLSVARADPRPVAGVERLVRSHMRWLVRHALAGAFSGPRVGRCTRRWWSP